MDNFLSEELKNATLVQSNLAEPIKYDLNLESLKDDLKLFILTKDKSLSKAYDIASLFRNNTPSGNDTLKSFLLIIKEYYLTKFREDNVKNVIIRKNIDIIFLLLDTLSISNIDISSNEVNTLMLSFMSKNFL